MSMMPAGREWRREMLDWRHSKLFAKVIRKGDLIECLSNGMSVPQSLDYAIYHGGGESWAVLEGSTSCPVGVYGWSRLGAIWSYWQDLDRDQGLELMQRTGKMVLEMVENANKTGLRKLANYVWEGNRPALSWLKASHCFSLDLDHRITIGNNRGFIPFETLPLEELRQNV